MLIIKVILQFLSLKRVSSVDLTKTLVSKFTIDGEEFKVEYENLQELCFNCGMYGHLCDACIHKPNEKERDKHGEGVALMEVNVKEIYGSWMMVEKRRRQQGREDTNGTEGGEITRGSRFDVLREEEQVSREAVQPTQSENVTYLMVREDRLDEVREGLKKCYTN